MKRRLSIAELIRQDALDLHPEPPRPPCLKATKAKKAQEAQSEA
jgi:hypothetical protein